ncbi:hypothetical protein ACFLQI_00350, partial [Candidatus Undinarchaeota archaeon]
PLKRISQDLTGPGIVAMLGVIVVSFILGSIPLYLSLKVITLGGDSKKAKKITFYKVLSVNLIGMVIVAAGTFFFNMVIGSFFGLASFILLLAVYKFGFGVSWSGALVAWLLQVIIAIILSAITVLLIGSSLFI